SMTYKLPDELQNDVQAALENWRKEGKVRRLSAADASLWTEADEAHWLGWLDIVDKQLKGVAQLPDFAGDGRRSGFRDVLLLGMGGSSLGPEVFAETFGSKPGYPKLYVLDSTDRRRSGASNLASTSVRRCSWFRANPAARSNPTSSSSIFTSG